MPTVELQAEGESRYTLDARPDRVDLRDRPYRPPLVSLPEAWPPAERAGSVLASFSEDGMVLDQLSEGACTGFGLAALVNYLCWRGACERGEAPPPKASARMAYHLARIYDEWPGEDYSGSSCRGAMKGWHHHGICTEDTWPYNRGRFTAPFPHWPHEAAGVPLGAYYRIDKTSVADMQAAIHQVGAVYASAYVHRGWANVAGGLGELPVIEPDSTRAGGHAFALVGYCRRGFIVQNSWGPGWGFHGFAVLSYADWTRNAFDAWVAVLGAPVALERYATTRIGGSLHAQAGRAGSAQVQRSPSARRAGTRPLRPLTEDEAYHHCIVLGNEGVPLNRLLVEENAASALQSIAHALPAKWLENRRKRRVVVYAHGGLVGEAAGLERARVLAPRFAANGIYPLFLLWKTGLEESLRFSLEDALARQFELDAVLGTMDEVELWAGEAKDRTLEAAARRFAKFIWSQIKENAAAGAATGGGLRLLARALRSLGASLGDVELHLAGHSAGANLLGHLLGRLGAEGLGVRTVSLYAPACTMRFAARHFGRAIANGTLGARDLHIDLLTDERERATGAGPYGKSVLYLISRALEELHKTPLLGLAAAWDPFLERDALWAPDAPRGDLWNARTLRDIDAWLSIWNGAPGPAVHGIARQKVSDGEGFIDLSHDSFDQDVAVLTDTLRRILARAPRVPVGSLRST